MAKFAVGDRNYLIEELVGTDGEVAMPAEDTEVPWEGRCLEAAYAFGRECAALARSKPYVDGIHSLTGIINTVMTELWDNGFSQTGIRTAFEGAIRDMPRYAAGEERRSSE